VGAETAAISGEPVSAASSIHRLHGSVRNRAYTIRRYGMLLDLRFAGRASLPIR
jgi:hypothetical protein